MILTEKVIKLVFAKLRRKGGIDMLKNVNPLNREPENMSTAAYRCACVCYTTAGHTSPSVTAALPVTEDCGCNCQSGNYPNRVANYGAAYRSSGTYH